MCARDLSLAMAMDSLAVSAPPPSAMSANDDEWDADGFEVPSLNPAPAATGFKDDEWDTEDGKLNGRKAKPAELLKQPILHKPIQTQTENLYLGPHGAKPGVKQPDSSSKKQRYKNKLRERDAHHKSGLFGGRENKVEVLRDLIGSKSSTVAPAPRSNSGEWLDPHCQESMFSKPSAKSNSGTRG